MIQMTSIQSKRIITLISAIFASLSAGTNYAYSAYSPQLGQRLSLSSTSLNVIGLAGNLGMYLSSPIVGRIIDRIGPTRPLLCAAVLVFAGYGLLWSLYERSSSEFALPLAALGTLLTGTGSSAALSSSAAGVACSFDASIRATVIGITLAGFGLSAFFWTGLGHLITDGDASGLLALLSLGPTLFMLIGAIGCRPVIDLDPDSEPSPGPDRSKSWKKDKTRQLNHRRNHSRQSSSSDRDENDDETMGLVSQTVNSKREVSGWGLTKESDFWLIWLVMGCCCGTTLMVINNVGTIVETLYESVPNNGSQTEMRGHQAAAVSVLSMFNCLGRIFAGVVSDGLESRIGLRRVWFLTFISTLFLISQISALTTVKTLGGVPFLSGLVGFAYGNIYGTAPALVLEWFGLRYFTANFGYLNLAPLVTGQVFNLSFGRIYDHHRDRSKEGKLLVCKIGPDCYRTSFMVTSFASIVALGLSIYLGIRISGNDQKFRKIGDGGNPDESFSSSLEAEEGGRDGDESNRLVIANESTVIA